VNIKIAGKWMFIPLKMVLIGIDPYPCQSRGRCRQNISGRWPWKSSRNISGSSTDGSPPMASWYNHSTGDRLQIADESPILWKIDHPIKYGMSPWVNPDIKKIMNLVM